MRFALLAMTACIFPMMTSDSHGQVNQLDSLQAVDFLDYYNQPQPEGVEESPSDVRITAQTAQKGADQKAGPLVIQFVYTATCVTVCSQRTLQELA